MAQRFDEEFRREVVRVAQTSGFSRKQIAADFGVGLSTLGKWLVRFGDQTGMSPGQLDQLKEIDRLRKELKIAREERDLLSWRDKETVQWTVFPERRQPSSSRSKANEVRLH